MSLKAQSSRFALTRLWHSLGRGVNPEPDRGSPSLEADSLRGFFRYYRFVDVATQGYLLLVGLLILLFHQGRVPHWPWLLAGHGVCLALVHTMIQWHGTSSGSPVTRFLRAYYPILLYTGFYRETGLLNQMFHSGYVDAVFIRADAWLFGSQPCLVWMERMPWRWLAEVMYGCYFSYYLMIAGIGLVLLFRNRGQFDHFITVVSFVFYACYLTYIFLPVMGPRVFFLGGAEHMLGTPQLPPDLLPEHTPVFPAAVQEGVFFRVVIWIYQHFEAPGAAFPSSHVAIALVTAYFSWRYLPKIRWVHAGLVLGLCLSTIYCRYHYVVDVLAGGMTAAIFVPMANELYRRWLQRGAASPRA